MTPFGPRSCGPGFHCPNVSAAPFILTDPTKRRSDGNELDSYLSNNIAALVQDVSSKYLNSNIGEVAKAIQAMIGESQTNSLRHQIGWRPLRSPNTSDQAANQLGIHISSAINSATAVVHSRDAGITAHLAATRAHMIGNYFTTATRKQLLTVVIRKLAAKAVVSALIPMLASLCGVVTSGALICKVPLSKHARILSEFKLDDKSIVFEIQTKACNLHESGVTMGCTVTGACSIGIKTALRSKIQQLAENSFLVSNGVGSEMRKNLKNRNRGLAMGIFQDLTRERCKDFAGH
ncbi:hypothetical protein DL96DRAFT_1553178 [Flagelloscypha sp. PMI_526]|nr:hypothetical protein DL96DRAFT_1553178 [Flagelloscypha sp. PMI_526]